MEELENSSAQLWRFVLGRAVHEFNNRVGGILSVSETHLARRIDDGELRESLELIREGAQAASDFVVTMADLLAADESTPELIRLSDLRVYLRTKLMLFLPRHIEVVLPPSPADALVRVNAKLLLFNLLAILQKELEREQPASFCFELTLKVAASTGSLIYRSTSRAAPRLAEFCKNLFSRMNLGSTTLEVRESPTEFKVAIGFAIVKAR
jgi:hypothetical protein